MTNSKEATLALIDSSSKVNTMTPAYAKKPGLRIQKTNIGAQKIDRSTLEIYGIVIASFQVQNMLEKARFFKETFLVVDTSVEVIFKMSFLTLRKVEIDFAKKKLT